MFKFRITDDAGESHELHADSRDIVNWEKTTRGASMNQLQDAMRFTDLYKIAYFTAKRTGVWSGDERTFSEMWNLEIEGDQESDLENPTP